MTEIDFVLLFGILAIIALAILGAIEFKRGKAIHSARQESLVPKPQETASVQPSGRSKGRVRHSFHRLLDKFCLGNNKRGKVHSEVCSNKFCLGNNKRGKVHSEVCSKRPRVNLRGVRHK